MVKKKKAAKKRKVAKKAVRKGVKKGVRKAAKKKAAKKKGAKKGAKKKSAKKKSAKKGAKKKKSAKKEKQEVNLDPKTSHQYLSCAFCFGVFGLTLGQDIFGLCVILVCGCLRLWTQTLHFLCGGGAVVRVCVQANRVAALSFNSFDKVSLFAARTAEDCTWARL